MGWEGYYVLGLTGLTLVLLVTGRAKVDAIGFLLMIALVGGGILPYGKAVEGFGNKAILTIAGLYVVGEGLTRTGALEFLAGFLLRITSGGKRRTILVTCLAAALASSFLNDTAVVVVLIPIVIDIARTTGIPAVHMLMPVSFAALLGGMNTLIGTSTNLLVSGVAESWGQPGIGMFEMTPLAAVLCLIGILYLSYFAPRLLPQRESLSVKLSRGDDREFLTELVIGPKSRLLDLPYAEAFTQVRARLAFYIRDDSTTWPPFDGDRIQEGDVLMFKGSSDEIADLGRELDLKYAAGPSSAGKEMGFYELAISPHSPLVGRRIEELRLWRDYGAVPLAILRAAKHVQHRLSQLPLRAGDLLLVLASDESEGRLQNSHDFYLISGAHRMIKLRARGRWALSIAGVVVVLFALSSIYSMALLPQPFVAILGGMGMIAAGCVTPRRVYRTIDWPILIFIAGTLALGEAMQRTGAAALVAEAIVGVLDAHGQAAILSGFVLLCVVLNTLIAHSAVAVLLTPIAIKTAQAMAAADGLAPDDPKAQTFLRACILAIAFGGSLCFATPIGHQVNLMVMGPGGYRYLDFVRLGLPLSLIAWVVISCGLPWLVGL